MNASEQNVLPSEFQERTPISSLVREYVLQRRNIASALRLGVIHYTDLGRRIAEHYGIDQLDACKMACRRLALELGRQDLKRKVSPRKDSSSDIKIQSGVNLHVFEKYSAEHERAGNLIRALQTCEIFMLSSWADTVSVVVPARRSAELISILKERPARTIENLAYLTSELGETSEHDVWPEEAFFSLLADRGVPLLMSAAGSRAGLAVCAENSIRHLEKQVDSAEFQDSISRLCHAWLDSHRSIRDALCLGLVNYAVLARQIAEEFQTDSVAAIASGLRRYARSRSRQLGIDEEILRTLRYSVCTAQSGIVESYFPIAQLAEGMNALNEVYKVGGTANFVATQSDITIFASTRIMRLKTTPRADDMQRQRRISRLEVVTNEITATRSGALDHLLSLLNTRGLEVLGHYTSHSHAVVHLREDQIGDAVRALFLEAAREVRR